MPLPRTWWVLTSFDVIPYARSLLVHFHTYPADHMFMWWSYYNPARKPIYKIIRGVRKFCGYTWGWKDPYTAEQIEEGDTREHTIFLPHLSMGATIYFMVWAPDGPYGMNIQGPLMHVHLLKEYPIWTRTLCIATRTHGIFKSFDFSGPGPDQPTWKRDNHGLDSLNIWQVCVDLNNPGYRRYIIAGGDLYMQETYIPKEQAWGKKILTNAQACTLTGSPSGTILWVATATGSPAKVFVLFNSGLTQNGTWLIRSHTIGRFWEAFQIYAGVWNRAAGNIMAGIEQGESPFEPGSVLYAALNTGGAGSFALYFSNNLGFSWNLMDVEGISLATQRVLVDPTDQSDVYMGVHLDPGDPNELYRSLAHGANLQQVDGAHHLGIFIDYAKGALWIDPENNFDAILLLDNRIWHTHDHCDNWSMGFPLEEEAQRLAVQPHQAGNLYLGRDTGWPPIPPPGGGHVIYVSDDDGLTMWGKAGANAHMAGPGDDSIPYTCGGVAHDGILLVP